MTEARSSYGTLRAAGVSYLEVERAAIALLKAGRRPSVGRVRATLGHGSPQTLLSALQRFWRDLGNRVEADPAALTRLPAEIVETVETLWQRALALAAQAAKHDDNAARERLAQLQIENDLRAKAFDLREKDWESAARAREQALSETRAHAVSLLHALEDERITRQSRERRIEALERQIEEHRRQLAELIARATARPRRSSTADTPVRHTVRRSRPRTVLKKKRQGSRRTRRER